MGQSVWSSPRPHEFFWKRSFIDQAYTWAIRNLDKTRFLKEIMSGQVTCPYSLSSPSYGINPGKHPVPRVL